MPRQTTKSPKKTASPPSVKKAGAKVSRPPSGQFVLGHERFARISAVEGIELTPAMKKRTEDFDARGLSSEERRREILKIYSKKT